MSVYQTPAPRAPWWPTALAWVVIAGCVGLIVVAGLRPRGPASAETDPAATASTDVLLQSRLAVGIHDLFGRGTDAGTGLTPAASLVTALDEGAKSPVARLRAIPAIAEIGGGLDGGEEARKRLNILAEDPTFPESLRGDLAALRTIYTEGPDTLDLAVRDELTARHGWFARLALSYGLPGTDPARRAAIAPATRAAWTMLAAIIGAGVGCVIGFGLLVWAVVAVADRRLRAAYVPPPPGGSGPFVQAFAIYMLGMVLLSLAIGRLFPRAGFAANWLLALSIPLAVVWPRLRGVSWADVRAGFGWHAGRGFVREAAIGVVGYVAALPLLALAVLVTSALARFSQSTPSHPIQQEAGAGGLLHALQLYALAVAYAPLVEETFFRGALYHHVRRRLPWWLAGVFVGVLFAAIHPQGWVGIPMLTTVAVVLAALREWRGSVIAPVVTHACVNAVTLTILILMTG